MIKAPPTLRVADSQVHHGRGQVSGAAAPTEAGVASVVLGVQRGGQRGGEVQVAEVGQGPPGAQGALVVGQSGVLLRRRKNAAGKVR